MAFYQQRGDVPGKRHTRQRIKGALTYEELISREGFSHIYSNVYHLRMPTAVKAIGRTETLPLTPIDDPAHRHRHLRSASLGGGGDWLRGRRALAFNSDLVIATAEPTESSDAFYRNARADELVFVHHGAGTLETNFGDLEFRSGDYVILPRGVIHRWRFDEGRVKLLVVESRGPVETPKDYRNAFGQLTEQAPYCERDIRTPEFRDPINKTGDFDLLIKVGETLQAVTMAHHPFDLVGWDGFYYPWIFNIEDFMPAVGKVHLPPPAHQTFGAPGFVVCSFVPRLFDFHPEAVPIPYAHSNVDSDEVLYYVKGDFMSRRGIEPESLTLHPMGYPHGPQPGLLEKSLGAKKTDEWAVMIDTFAPLTVARDAAGIDDPDYPRSWL